MEEEKKNSGQIALIVLLVMVVVLTVGLALVSRTVSDVRISQDEEEAIRAFSAAEAGIEYYLGKASLSAGDYSLNETDLGQSGVSAEVDINKITEDYTATLNPGQVMNVLLDNNSGYLRIRWSDEDKSGENNPIASLGVTVYNYDGSNYSVDRYALKGDSTDSSSNEFTGITLDNDLDDDFRRITDTAGGDDPIDLESDDQLARIRVLENEATLQVFSSSGSLPVQGYELESRATTDEDKSSRVIVEKTVPVLLPIFDYALYSNGTINKT